MVLKHSLPDSQQALSWVTQTQPTLAHPVDLLYVKIVPAHDTKAYRWSRRIAPFILALTVHEVGNITARPLYPRERTPVPIKQLVG
jgi:hypothetical protein